MIAVQQWAALLVPEVTVMVHCNNEKCRFYNAEQVCTSPNVYYIDRLCVTFRRIDQSEKARGCEYYSLIKQDIMNCCNCRHWTGHRCSIEDKLKRNYQTDINHGPVKR